MPSPVPLAFCITDLDPGGAERALVQIVTRLPREHWAPCVYALGPEAPLVGVLQKAGIPVTCLGARSWRDVGAVWTLSRLLRRQRPQLLQTFLFHANVVGRLAGWGARVPVVVSGIRVAEREQRWHVALERWTRRLATHHVCASQGVAEFAVRAMRLPSSSVSVIRNGVAAEEFANAAPADLTEFGIPQGATTLLFVGRLAQQKGVMILLDAAAPLLADDPNLHLLLVGAGPLEADVRRWIAEHRTAKVHLAGWRSDVPRMMKACTVLVLPSLWEGFPNVVLEALAAGRSVVATAVEGVDELRGGFPSLHVIPPRDPKALREALRGLLQIHPADRSASEHISQVLISERFTWNAIAAEYSALYSQLLGQNAIM